MKLSVGSKKSSKKGLRKKINRAHKAWAHAIFLFVTVLILGGVGAGYMFVHLSSIDPNFVAEENNSRQIIDQELLFETIEYYDNREATFEQYRNATPTAPKI